MKGHDCRGQPGLKRILDVQDLAVLMLATRYELPAIDRECTTYPCLKCTLEVKDMAVLLCLKAKTAELTLAWNTSLKS